MKLHDQHIHTIYSADSMASLEEYYQLAQQLGCKYFVTTEHVDLDIAGKGVDWLADFSALKKHLDNISLPNGPIPLLGIELGYRNDLIPRFQKIFEDNQFDIINLSVHDNGKFEYYFIEAFEELGLKKTMQVYYEQILDAVTTIDKFNVLSHIDYGFKTALKIDKNYDFFSDKELLERILTKLINKGKALEVNVKVQRYMTKEHLRELLNFYKSLGGTKVTLSSDSHKVETYLNYFDEYKEIIKSCGFNYLCYYIKQIEYHFDI